MSTGLCAYQNCMVCTVVVGEALRLCESLQWVTNLGPDDMDFSLDLKHVVDAVNSNNSSNTDFGSITSHCRQLLNAQVTNSKVEFSCRQANEVTRESALATQIEASS